MGEHLLSGNSIILDNYEYNKYDPKTLNVVNMFTLNGKYEIIKLEGISNLLTIKHNGVTLPLFKIKVNELRTLGEARAEKIKKIRNRNAHI